jgi:23S rRNA pseudouridine1911/1915/1917 synthase
MAEGFIALFKPAGFHSTILASQKEMPRNPDEEPSLLSWIYSQPPSESWREVLQEGWESGAPEPRGMAMAATELGMLSRLDRDTSGIVVFATHLEAYKEAKALQGLDRLQKSYRFIASSRDPLGSGGGLEGSRPLEYPLDLPGLLAEGKEFKITSRFRSFGPRGSRVACLGLTEGTEKEKRAAAGVYKTTLRFLGSHETAVLGEAMIHRGFRHQIRAHLAWSGYPIVGDALYGGPAAERMYLEAFAVELQRLRAPSLKFDLAMET